ncbi:MAG TPA: molybdenum cofactor biosynthesis protein MoaE [Thermoanaerobaculia bacterium]|jgi:molybdopterin synthase catalytic subunit|nr:molybdenum cofactor biosynthesis protein MoaE [Thermoanaerobaculia bacterium]
MKICLLAFASAGDALGASEMEIEMPEGSRVADLRTRLDREHPGIVPLWPRLAVAVDGKVVSLEEPLRDGVEVALLPPVSGGSGGPPLAELVDGPIDSGRAMAAVLGPDRGAAVVFLGTVRDHHAGRPVAKLTYSAYRSMALEGLRRIVTDLEASAPGLRATIVHRLGEVPVGEASVVIAVSSPHRAAAYEASRTALERLKAEIPIWKREHYADGEAAWREEEPLIGVIQESSR